LLIRFNLRPTKAAWSGIVAIFGAVFNVPNPVASDVGTPDETGGKYLDKMAAGT
jgi:hypothetical protein